MSAVNREGIFSKFLNTNNLPPPPTKHPQQPLPAPVRPIPGRLFRHNHHDGYPLSGTPLPQVTRRYVSLRSAAPRYLSLFPSFANPKSRSARLLLSSASVRLQCSLRCALRRTRSLARRQRTAHLTAAPFAQPRACERRKKMFFERSRPR